MSEIYDIAIIGSGPGGYRAAVLAALRGQKVVIIEKHTWGGCCLNRGCVPKKAWHQTATLLAASGSFTNRGIQGTLTADLQGAWEHQRNVVETVRKSYVNYMKSLGIDRLVGHGTLEDANTIRVGETRIHTRHVILATGSSARLPEGLPPVPGRILTTDMLFDQRPPTGRRVAVVGAGVIGAEFSFILAQFGAEVVWLCNAKPLTKSGFSAPALSTWERALRESGVTPSTGARIQNATVTDDGVRLAMADGSELDVDWVLLGTGRIPNTTGVGLDTVRTVVDERGFIRRNEFLQTDEPNIYAIGDCTSPQMTANQALADATVAVHNIIAGNERRQDPLWVPQAIYSAVELARIGLNEDEAEDQDLEPAVGFAAFETSPRALGQDDTAGFVRLIGDMDSGALLGGELVGAEAGELIHLLSLAPDRDTALKWLAGGRYNHPARAEEFLNAAETMASKWGLQELIFQKD